MKYSFLIGAFFFCCFVNSANAQLTVKEWGATSTDKPLVFYITGDGGFNSFSSGLCNALNKNGYEVAAVSSRTYFWNRKTPQQTGADVQNYLAQKIQRRKNQSVVLVGYSFGGDVMPFVYNNLSASLKKNIQKIFLLSPTATTDMEIHVTDMFGEGKKRGMDVVAEINKINNTVPVHIVSATGSGFPIRLIKRPHTISMLQGEHKFNDANLVSQLILKNL